MPVTKRNYCKHLLTLNLTSTFEVQFYTFINHTHVNVPRGLEGA